MDEVQVAEFRTNFGKLDAPTRVVRYGRTVGDWYPAGHECTAGAVPVDREAERSLVERAQQWAREKDEEIDRLKRELASARSQETLATPASLGPRTVVVPSLDDDLVARESHRLAEQARARAEFEAESEQRRAWQRRMVTPQKSRG